MKTVIAFSIIAITTAGLAKAAGKKPETAKQEAKAEGAFKLQGDYIFKVTHQADTAEVRLPSSPIPDEAYKPKKGAQLGFSVKGTKLKFETRDISHPLGQSSKNENERIYKTLDPNLDGNFEMTLKRTKDGVVGTLTSFGSGVPVLFSYRGVVAEDKAAKAKPKK